MIEIQINNKVKTYIPSEYNEVPLSRGIEVLHFIKNESSSHNDKIAILSSLSELEPDIFMLMSKKSTEEIFDNISFLKMRKDENVVYYPVFKLGKTWFGQIDYDKITFSEFADIDQYLSESEYPLENLAKVLTVLFRPIKNKKQSFKNVLINKIRGLFYKNLVPLECNSYEIEEYNEEVHSKNEFLFSRKLDMGFALAAFQIMMEKRQQIMDEFPTIFKSLEVPDEDKDQYDEPDPKRKQTKSFEQIWGLYHCLCSVSNSLQERLLWKKSSIREFFVYLSYFNGKVLMENQRIKNMNLNG